MAVQLSNTKPCTFKHPYSTKSPRLTIKCHASSDLQRRNFLSAGVLLGSVPSFSDSAKAETSSVYDFSAAQYGQSKSLEAYRGQVLVIMNIASNCTLHTINYPSLRQLYEKYKDDGFSLIAFPCNQFLNQAPGSNEEEREFAVGQFGKDFDVFDKIEVNGDGAHPLYKFLKQRIQASAPSDVPSRPFGEIEWNYTKFLIDRNGQPVRRYKPSFDPLQMENDIRMVLAGKDPLPLQCFSKPGSKICKVESYV